MTVSVSITERHADAAVEIFLNSVPEPREIVDVLQSVPGPRNPKLDAIIALQEVSLGRREFEEATKLAEDAYCEESHVDLHIIYLLAWIRILIFKKTQLPQMEMLFERARAQITVSTPDTIRAWATFIESTVRLLHGDVVRSDELLRQVPNIIQPSSPHYKNLIVLCAITKWAQGKGSELDPVVLQFEKESGDVFDKRGLVARFINSALTGDLETANEVFPLINGCAPIEISFWQDDFDAAKWLVKLMVESRGKKNATFDSAEQSEDIEPLWVGSTRALLEGNVSEALRLANEQVLGERRTVVGFEEYTLIRAHIASRNSVAARESLQARFEGGTEHYIDDLFMARIELLEGNQEKAAGHFAVLDEAINRYNAAGRLDFELSLSAELEPRDLVLLRRNRMSLSKTAQS